MSTQYSALSETRCSRLVRRGFARLLELLDIAAEVLRVTRGFSTGANGDFHGRGLLWASRGP
jgi:hypothetical protein